VQTAHSRTGNFVKVV